MALIPSLTGSVAVDIILILFTYYLVTATISYRRLAHIPGPKLWGWSILPLFRLHLNGGIYDTLGELCDKYGPFVRIGPNWLLTSDPDVLRKMNASRSPYTRSDWYNAMRMVPGQDNVISYRSEDKHNEMRAKMINGYSGKEVGTLEADIDECVYDLLNLIETKYVSTPGDLRPMDVGRKFQFFTSDVISKLAFNAKFGDLNSDNDNFGYIHEVETLFPNIFCTCLMGGWLDRLTKIGFLGLFAPTAKSHFGLGKVLGITEAQINKRFDAEGQPLQTGEAKRSDMLASFIRHGMTQKEANMESVFQMAAGSDTTATGLRAILLGIISSPNVYQKLRAEIDAAVKSGKMPEDDGEIIPNNQALELPYLQACIKEGLRWYPPIAGMLSKEVPKGGDTLCGYFVPEGTAVGYSAKATHHNKELFKPDPTNFRPERWLEASEGQLKEMEKNNELIFGWGKYQCLGKPVAFIEMNKVLAELFKRYDLHVMNTLKPWKTTCYGIHLQREFWVTVRKREDIAQK